MNLRFNSICTNPVNNNLCVRSTIVSLMLRAVAIKSNNMFNLTDLMTISLPKADRKNLC